MSASTASGPRGYHPVTKVFHWLTALLILTVAPLGAMAVRLPYETNAELAFKAQVFSLHKTLGVVLFIVALLRILWALGQPKPGPLHPERQAETFLAAMVHWLLYISLVAVPLTGWIHHAATEGFAPILLPISQDLPFVPNDAGIAALFGGLHWVWSKVLMAAVLLHIAGALKHQIIDRDATLRRMWFGKAEAPAVAAHAGGWTAPLVALAIYLLATAAGAVGGLYAPHEARPGVDLAGLALEDVRSDWVVETGEIGITITQFGRQVSGGFADFTAAIAFDPEAEGVLGTVDATIAISSLTLGTATNDALGSAFFDAATFPRAQFTAELRAGSGDGPGYLASGTLTIRDITLPLEMPFDLELTGDRAEMTAMLTLDRRDFGIGAHMPDESNLGFAVDVSIRLSALRTEG